MPRKNARSDADADAEFAQIDGNLFLKCANQTPANIMDRLNRLGVLIDESELIAAQARHKAQTVRHFFQALGDAHEHPVAEYMSETVVEVFEVVDIEKIHADMSILHRRAIDGRVQQRRQM